MQLDAGATMLESIKRSGKHLSAILRTLIKARDPSRATSIYPTLNIDSKYSNSQPDWDSMELDMAQILYTLIYEANKDEALGLTVELDLFIPVAPFVCPRPRVTRKGFAYMDKTYMARKGT